MWAALRKFIEIRSLDGLMALSYLNRQFLEELHRQDEILRPYVELTFSTLAMAAASKCMASEWELVYSPVLQAESKKLRTLKPDGLPSDVVNEITKYIFINKGSSLSRLSGFCSEYEGFDLDLVVSFSVNELKEKIGTFRPQDKTYWSRLSLLWLKSLLILFSIA